jgi:hypothetical protein
MDTETEIRHVVARVSARHPEVPQDRVEQLVREEFAAYADATVHSFVPVLAQRGVEQRLRAVERAGQRSVETV